MDHREYLFNYLLNPEYRGMSEEELLKMAEEAHQERKNRRSEAVLHEEFLDADLF